MVHIPSGNIVKFGGLELSHHKGMILLVDNRVKAEKVGGHEKLIRPSVLMERIRAWVKTLIQKRHMGYSDEDDALLSFLEKATKLVKIAKAYGDPCSAVTQAWVAKHGLGHIHKSYTPKKLLDHNGKPFAYQKATKAVDRMSAVPLGGQDKEINQAVENHLQESVLKAIAAPDTTK